MFANSDDNFITGHQEMITDDNFITGHQEMITDDNFITGHQEKSMLSDKKF